MLNHKEKQRGCPLVDANKHTYIYIYIDIMRKNLALTPSKKFELYTKGLPSMICIFSFFVLQNQNVRIQVLINEISAK